MAVVICMQDTADCTSWTRIAGDTTQLQLSKEGDPASTITLQAVTNKTNTKHGLRVQLCSEQVCSKPQCVRGGVCITNVYAQNGTGTTVYCEFTVQNLLPCCHYKVDDIAQLRELLINARVTFTERFTPNNDNIAQEGDGAGGAVARTLAAPWDVDLRRLALF